MEALVKGLEKINGNSSEGDANYSDAVAAQLRYLVPRDMSVGQFMHILSNRLRLAPGKALFMFVKDTLPQTTSLMQSVYESFKDEDGFLYMCYSSENTFGCGMR